MHGHHAMGLLPGPSSGPLGMHGLHGAGPSVPPEIKEQLDQLREDMNKMRAAADEAARKGDEEASKFKGMLAGEIGEKIKELEEKHQVFAPQAPKMGGMPLPYGGCGGGGGGGGEPFPGWA
mmetsp:Transcript_36259/g.79249  ORF Transcript_36259/g.79249 Transcript_36259/m.79249 type:complete len:121 (-) Transcript_36259:2275-2637(-)